MKYSALGTREEQDEVVYPIGIVRVSGRFTNTARFRSYGEASAWMTDCSNFCKVTASANEHDGDIRVHKRMFEGVVLPTLLAFMERWGAAKVPHDIRWSVSDGFNYFNLDGEPVFPEAVEVYDDGRG